MTTNKPRKANTVEEDESPVIHPTHATKRQLNPINLVWIAVFFFLVDYLAFQKPLPKLIAWLLIVIPLLLIAIAFFIWARRKQFPWPSSPSNPLVVGNLLNDEKTNFLQAVMVFLVCVFLITLVTYIYLFPK